MKKLLCVLLLALLIPAAVLADALPMDFSAGHVANPDNYTDSSYEDESITVTVEHVWVQTTAKTQARFNVAHVKIADPSQLRIGLAAPLGKSKTNRISTIAASCNAVVAIGGDYYANEDGGYVVRMTQEARKKPRKGHDMLITDENGDFHIVIGSDSAELKALLESGITVVNAFNFGPALVVDGQLSEKVGNYSFYNPNGYEPRCAIGQVGPLEYVLVVVDGGKGRDVTCENEDGTKTKSTGCTQVQLAQFMYEQGCVQAYNLDGGNSALMVFGGNNYSQKTVKAERSVSDIIYFATSVDFGLDGEGK